MLEWFESAKTKIDGLAAAFKVNALTPNLHPNPNPNPNLHPNPNPNLHPNIEPPPYP